MSECKATLTGEHSFRERTRGSEWMATKAGLVKSPVPPTRVLACVCGVIGGDAERQQLRAYAQEQRRQSAKAQEMAREQMGASQGRLL